MEESAMLMRRMAARLDEHRHNHAVALIQNADKAQRRGPHAPRGDERRERKRRRRE
jgi:hypothetical protein